MSADRKALFQQVALIQLQTRKAAVIRGTAQGDVVCPSFLKDVALITETILDSSQEFQNVRYKTKEAIDEMIQNHKEILDKLIDRPQK